MAGLGAKTDGAQRASIRHNTVFHRDNPGMPAPFEPAGDLFNGARHHEVIQNSMMQAADASMQKLHNHFRDRDEFEQRRAQFSHDRYRGHAANAKIWAEKEEEAKLARGTPGWSGGGGWRTIDDVYAATGLTPGMTTEDYAERGYGPYSGRNSRAVSATPTPGRTPARTPARTPSRTPAVPQTPGRTPARTPAAAGPPGGRGHTAALLDLGMFSEAPGSSFGGGMLQDSSSLPALGSLGGARALVLQPPKRRKHAAGKVPRNKSAPDLRCHCMGEAKSFRFGTELRF